MSNTAAKPFFPFGFRYPKGFPYSSRNPDPKIESVRLRMKYLNEVHAISGLPGHVFAAAMDLFQAESPLLPDYFWVEVQANFSKEEVAEIAKSIAPSLTNVVPPLEFPNAIALFDCRFVSTSEWEHIRRYSIGGSEAATVLGLSHFQTPLSLYYEKRCPHHPKKDISNRHILDYGHAVEDYIVESFASRLGAVRYPEYRMFAHKDYPFLTCNPDGIFYFMDGHISLFEAKSAFWKKRDDWKDGIPDYYEPQPRHYMEVLNDPRLNDGFIGVCLGAGDNDLIPQHYIRDHQKGAEQVQKLVDYWNTYIEPDIPPAFSGNAELDIEAAYGYVAPALTVTGQTDLPDTAIADFEQYYTLQEARKRIDANVRLYKQKEEQYLNQILPLCPDGLTICTQPNEMSFRIKIKDTKTQTVDFASFLTQHPRDARTAMLIAAKLKEQGLDWTTPKIASKALKIPKRAAKATK